MQTAPKLFVLGLTGRSIFFSLRRFPAEGETVQSERVFIEPGGKGCNQAVAAARIGASVAYATALGGDAYAAECEAFLHREPIRRLHLLKKEQYTTATAAILTDRSGANRVVVYPGASGALTPQDVEALEYEIAQSRYLLLQLEYPLDTVEHAVRIARRRQVRVVLDPAPSLPGQLELLRGLYLITPNRQEAETLLGLTPGQTPAQLARAFREAGFERVIVTLGAQGALAVEDGHAYLVHTSPVSAQDTAGAGDVFNGVLCAYLSERGCSLLDAARRAAVAAAYSVTREHVMGAIPTKEQLKASGIRCFCRELCF